MDDERIDVFPAWRRTGNIRASNVMRITGMRNAIGHAYEMIRHLLLIRHAKSDWNDPTLSDFDRPLNSRGKKDAPQMGKRLAKLGIHPQRMVSSPAQRARSTAESIANQIGFPLHDIDWMTELYLASPFGMLDVIRTCPSQIDTLILVGHNPGISELVPVLCDAPVGNIPTCGIVHLRAELNSWSQAGRFSLVDFDYPKRNK